jgi:hypothetical protein
MRRSVARSGVRLAVQPGSARVSKLAHTLGIHFKPLQNLPAAKVLAGPCVHLRISSSRTGANLSVSHHSERFKHTDQVQQYVMLF